MIKMNLHTMIKRNLILFCLTISAFLCQYSHAKEYAVELLIFSYDNPSSAWAESWPDDIALGFPQSLLTIGGNLPELSNLRLNSAAQKLNAQNDISVLFHKAWKQDLTNRNSSVAVRIQGGPNYGNNQALEGWVKISVERYLHIRTDLWLSRGNTNIPQPFNASLVSGSDSYSMDTTTQGRTFVMRQSRKTRSDEVQYLDHPMFGVMAIINPIGE